MLVAAALAAMLSSAPAVPAESAPQTAAVAPRLPMGGIEQLRLESRTHRASPRLAQLAASIGASLAWEIADPPSHQARLPEPIGGFVSGAAFGALHTGDADRPGGAIAMRIARWNALYPPYALGEATVSR